MLPLCTEHNQISSLAQWFCLDNDNMCHSKTMKTKHLVVVLWLNMLAFAASAEILCRVHPRVSSFRFICAVAAVPAGPHGSMASSAVLAQSLNTTVQTRQRDSQGKKLHWLRDFKRAVRISSHSPQQQWLAHCPWSSWCTDQTRKRQDELQSQGKYLTKNCGQKGVSWPSPP